jgi:hypothetical protein
MPTIRGDPELRHHPFHARTEAAEVGVVVTGHRGTRPSRSRWTQNVAESGIARPERAELGPAEALAHLEGVLAVGIDVLVPAG